MADLIAEKQPGSREQATAHPTDAGIARVRLELHAFAIQAGRGVDGAQFAAPLRDLFARELTPRSAASVAERLRLGTAFVRGVCALARWFDPARSTQVVPPLCVVLWHVGRGFASRAPSTLWLDVVLPDDARRVAAVDWALDIRLLLMQAGIPHRAETVLAPPITLSPAPAAAEAQALGAWGCMSLLEAYRCSGEVTRRSLR